MKVKLILTVVGAILLLILLSASTYVVQETEQVVITQFGKPVGQAVTEPGMHFKIPFIQHANYFEKRYMEWDGEPNQVPTKDKKFIFVDTYARWQITDPLQFFKRLRNERGAHSRLDDILDGETREFIAKNNLEEAVRTSNRTPVQPDSGLGLTRDTLQTILVGRKLIQEQILKAANEETKDLGIKVLDFRVKRINYVEEVRQDVYGRMKSERIRIADEFRSEGQGEASRINGEKSRDLKKITSEAFRKAEQIKGRADSTAAKVYADSYDQTIQARNLYGFLKSLETFEKTLNKKTSVILSTDSELYKYLKRME